MRTPRLLTFVFGALALGAPGFADDGAVLGRVLVDSTGLPLPAASVTLGGAAGTSDTEGRYVLFAPAGAQTIVVQAAGFVTASRPVAVAADSATLAFDVRLTPLAAAVAIDQAGGELRTGALAVTVPAGAVNASTEFRLTGLSGQGLPARLPLGWAPVLAWDVRASAAVSGSLSAHATDLPGIELHLVRYRADDQAWVMVQSALAPDQGQLGVDLADPGAYAFVAADAAPAPPIPGPGGVLVGVPAIAPAGGLIGNVRVEPPLASSSGGIGRAFLRLESPTALPSGTVFQVRLADDYLVDGEPVFEEPRQQDVVLYRTQPASGSVLETVLPVRAVQSFPAERVVTGWVQVELWTRAQDTGGVLGGQDAATLESGGFRLDVAAASLPANTVLRLASVPISIFVPTSPAATPLGEVVVDLSGATLGTPAELSLAAPGLSPGDVVVIARVETFDAAPYLQVVSLAQVVNGRAVSVPHAALPGIVNGGRYVFFRLAGPVGFVRGTLSTAAGPVRAIARSTALPFAAISPASGSYTLTAAASGSVAVTASVPRTTYQTTGATAVTAGQISTLDLTLAGAATTVTVTPADNATGLPVNTMVEIVASVPFGASTVTTQNVRLHEGAAGGPQVTVRFVLSQGNRRVAVIPDVSLRPSQLYTLVVTGLRDAYGATVAVPNTRFTTRSDEAPAYDLDRLTFSFPDEEGMVQVTATPGSFPAGSHLMILNHGNQVVLTLTVDNDGGVSGTLPATLDDAMMVTLTDPDGRTLTKNVSRYVDAVTGRTAVGVFGGTVDGPGGLQLRLPEGAVQKGIVFKLENVPPATIPVDKRPDILGATLSSAVRIISEDKPTFGKEVDLVFPKPADAPAGAFYYVYRQLQGQDGKVVNETIDWASVEGDKVVTASDPFPGYLHSLGTYALTPAGEIIITAVANNVAYLMWTYDELLPGKAKAAVFSGKVLRTRWDPQTNAYVYEGVPRVAVRRVQLTPPYDPFVDGNGVVAFTRADGTYTFTDSTFSAGVATIRATDPSTGQKLDATAFAVTKPPWAEPFRALATANVTFPALQHPPPAPGALIKVLVRENGAWHFADEGVVVTGAEIAIGIAAANAAVMRMDVDGEEVALQSGGPDYLGMPEVARYVPLQAGVHTIDALLEPISGPRVVRSAVFLAVAEGGGNNVPLPGPPRVLRTTPAEGAKDISPELMPEVVFTEPVTNVLVGDNIRLIETATNQPAAFELSGTGPSGPVLNVVPTSVVSSLTLRPASGLRYGTSYTLTLASTIVDRDTGQPGDPKALVAHSSEFKTYPPGVIGSTEERFPSPGLVVLDDRAYLVHNTFVRGHIRTFDIGDPDRPREVPQATNSVDGRPVDIGGLDETEVSEGRLIAVGTTATADSLPSNIQLFDASGDRMARVGVASLSSSAVEGTLVRFVVRQGYVYALTQRRGVQVLDMAKAKENYEQAAGDPDQFFAMMRDLNTDGRGFGHDAVVRTVPVRNESTHWLLSDIDAGDYTINGVQQTLAIVTGQIGLGIVNTVSGALTQVPLLQTAGGASRLTFGRALALGRVGTVDVALVAGTGKVDGADTLAVLFVVSLANPLAPQVVGVVSLSSGLVALEGSPTDVVLSDEMAIVAGARNAVVISLADLTRPALVGAIAGLGGRLALDANGVVYSTTQGPMGGSDPLDGLQSAALGPIAILNTDPARLVVSELSERTAEEFKLKYRVIPSDFEITAASKIQFVASGQQVAQLPAPIAVDGPDQGKGEIPLSPGFTFPRSATGALAFPRLVVNAGAPRQLASPFRNWKLSPVRLIVAPQEPSVEPPPGVYADEVTADFPQSAVTLISDEWFDRTENLGPDERAVTRSIVWDTGTTPPLTQAGASLADDGIFETTLNSLPVTGHIARVTAKVGDVVLATSDPVRMEPGVAATAALVAERTDLPADATSETLLTVEAKDAFGNLVADGTAVVWETADGTDGQFVETQTVTDKGRATTRYRAGVQPGPKVIRAMVDDAVGEVTITQATIGITWEAPPESRSYHDRSALELRARFTSTAGPVAQGAPVSWFASIGTMVPTQPLTAGLAAARWEFTRAHHRPRVFFVVSLGHGRQQHRMLWTTDPAPLQFASATLSALQAPPSAPVVSVAPMVMAGDLTADGEVPFERPDGTFEQVRVKASATYRVSGLIPGERVRVRLGTAKNPNVPPVAHYTGEEVSGEHFPDATGMHHGHATGGVSVVEGGYHGQGYSFDGAGEVTVPHQAEFGFAGAFMVQAAVKAPTGPAPHVLVEKEGEYRLSLVEQGGLLHARFAVATASGEREVISGLPVSTGWTLVSGRYQGGQLSVGVGDQETSVALLEPPLHLEAPILIGPGYAGLLDEIRIFDLDRSPLSSFAGGGQEISFLADGTGIFEAQIVSNGQLAPEAQLAHYYRLLDGERPGPADDQPPATERGYGWVFTQAQTYWEDRGETETTDVGYVTSAALAFFSKFGRGIFVGSDGEFDAAVMAGDLFGSILMSPVVLVRDVINATDRVISMQADGADGLTLAVGVVRLAGALVKGKAAALAKTALAAKVITPGSRASRPMARLLAAEARFTAGAGGVSRIKKLVELADLGNSVCEAIGAVLDYIGDRDDSIEHVNNVLDNAENSEEALDELKAFPQEFTREELRLFLAATGTPLDEGAPASADANLAWVKLAKETLKGARSSREIFVGAALARKASAFAENVKEYHGGQLKQIYDMINGLQPRLGPNRGNMHRLMSDLIHPWPQKRAGALLELKVAYGASAELKVSVGVTKTIITADGRARRRVVDAIKSTANGTEYWDEVANWRWASWGGFPPLPPSGPNDFMAIIHSRALKAKEKQFLLSLVEIGPNAKTRFRMVFGDGLDVAGKAALRRHFLKLVRDPRLRSYMVRRSAQHRSADLRRYYDTIFSVISGIDRIVEFK